MSAAGASRPVSVHDLAGKKRAGERFAMLTAYDFLTAQILDEAGVPVLLVGDSVGDNVLGYDSTIPVTVDEMVHHTAAVMRGARQALVVADMPFGSYQASDDDGVRCALRLLKEAGAGAVKLEGGARVTGLVRRLVAAGVPVMGHLGLTPQSIHQLGGYRVQGRDEESADELVADAHALASAGAFAVVLECVPADLARRVTDEVAVPTIGIGAGPHCDGQVLVVTDLLGLRRGPAPRFVKPYANLRSQMTDAAKAFQTEVRHGDYPASEHAYE